MAKNLLDATYMLERIADFKQPLKVFEIRVPEVWTDFNGHMNEARYLDCFSNASDGIMQLIGCDAAYISAGKSFFTVETHICHVAEAHAGAMVYVTTQILPASGKKLHLFHLLMREMPDGQNPQVLASGEQMLLHVDLGSRKTCMPKGEMAENMARLVTGHQSLPRPGAAGKSIG